MADTMIRGMAANKQVRFFACNSTDTVEKKQELHIIQVRLLRTHSADC